MRTCAYFSIFPYMHMYAHAHTHVHEYALTCTYAVHVHVRTRTHTRSLTYTHTNTHTHAHTQDEDDDYTSDGYGTDDFGSAPPPTPAKDRMETVSDQQEGAGFGDDNTPNESDYESEGFD